MHFQSISTGGKLYEFFANSVKGPRVFRGQYHNPAYRYRSGRNRQPCQGRPRHGFRYIARNACIAGRCGRCDRGPAKGGRQFATRPPVALILTLIAQVKRRAFRSGRIETAVRSGRFRLSDRRRKSLCPMRTRPISRSKGFSIGVNTGRFSGNNEGGRVVYDIWLTG